MNCSQLKFGWLNTLTGETKTHDFALGLGPCGRWVTELTVEIDLATVRVVQTSYDMDYATEDERLTQLIKRLDREHRVATGGYKCAAHGWDNPKYCTPTIEDWSARQSQWRADRQELCTHLPEVKHFLYRLEDIRGRITAL